MWGKRKTASAASIMEQIEKLLEEGEQNAAPFLAICEEIVKADTSGNTSLSSTTSRQPESKRLRLRTSGRSRKPLPFSSAGGKRIGNTRRHSWEPTGTFPPESESNASPGAGARETRRRPFAFYI